MIIEKRTRVLSTDSWGDWAATTDTPTVDGYVNTEFVEYRAVDDNTIVDIESITSNNTVNTAADGVRKYVTGDGYFDKMMEAMTNQLVAQKDSGYISGPEYAKSYVALAQSTMQHALQFALQKEKVQIDVDKSKSELRVAESTEQDKINTSAKQYAKLVIEADIAASTKQDKIDLSTQQLEKAKADVSYVGAQETALVEQVIDNRKIKTLNALADTYGTFGAGGLTLSEDMWKVYFALVADLATILNDYIGGWDIFNQTEATAIETDIEDRVDGDYYIPTNRYLGEFDASTSTSPTITTMIDGDYYEIVVSGTVGGTVYEVGDYIVYRTASSAWGKEQVAMLEGHRGWTATDIAVRSGNRWKKSLASAPQSTDVTKVTDTTE